ncbi:SMC-Scp complex subunit ScpB [Candidatus Woesearchaeota archaeon]|nr:hypothetical protein [uncultured archaeon]MBS3167306.1 SMC-Scp complex subunit ScpB [Candidatus Woesearchaeota archaeon]
MEDVKNRIEAILFVLNKGIELQRLSELLGIGSVGIVQNAINELVKDYSEKNSAIEIIEEEGKFRMNIRRQYVSLVKDLMTNTELDRPLLETLSVIAWKQPILQSEVVKIRGTTTYEHMQALTEMGFVTTEKFGTSKIVKLTQKFYDYFDTNQEAIKGDFTKYKKKIEDTAQTEQALAQRLEEIQKITEHNKKVEEQEKSPETQENSIEQEPSKQEV